jgi:hypothetical protein
MPQQFLLECIVTASLVWHICLGKGILIAKMVNKTTFVTL